MVVVPHEAERANQDMYADFKLNITHLVSWVKKNISAM